MEITIDAGAAKSVWSIRNRGVTTTSAKMVRLAAASVGPIHVEGDATLEFAREGKKCNMKFLYAVVSKDRWPQ